MIPFTFNEEKHIYEAPGWFVLGTSEILSLNNFVNFGQIPKAVLDKAAERGSQVHKAIEWFETDPEPPSMSEEIEGYFRGWLKFKLAYDFEPVGEMEKRIVYPFGEDEQAIGATMDARGTLKSEIWPERRPYVLDIKCTHKQAGVAAKQKALCWRLQLQSYCEATGTDEPFWKLLIEHNPHRLKLGRGIVHLQKDGEYTFHDYSSIDDSQAWQAAVHVAQLKLRNGFPLPDRR